MFVTDAALRIHDKSLGRAVHAKIDSGSTSRVISAGNIRIAKLAQPSQSFAALVFPVQAVDGHLARQSSNGLVLNPTGKTPAAPYVEDVRRPQERSFGNGGPRVGKAVQAEVGSRFANQYRRQLAWIIVEPRVKKGAKTHK